MTAEEAIATFSKRAEKRGLRFLKRSSEAVEIDTSGFPVGLCVADADTLVVTGGDWHEHFDDFDEALNCGAFLLSSSCRLKTVYYGSTVRSCTVQSVENGEWQDQSMVGFFFVPFWKPKRVEVRQNDVIEAP